MSEPATPPTTPPAGDSGAGAGNATPPIKDDAAVKLAEELGQIKARASEYEEYIKKVVPILQEINSDPELSAKVLEKVNKKAGGAPQTPPATDKKGGEPQDNTPKAPDPVGVDTRNAVTLNIVESFMNSKGISKLPETEAKKVREMVSNQFAELVDPQGNKTLPQILQEISLTRLPKFLENAWSLVENRLVKQNDPLVPQLNKAGAPGTIGSLATAGGSSDGDDSESLVLTDSERKIAQNMGIPEDKYLENKKVLAKRRATEHY